MTKTAVQFVVRKIMGLIIKLLKVPNFVHGMVGLNKPINERLKQQINID